MLTHSNSFSVGDRVRHRVLKHISPISEEEEEDGVYFVVGLDSDYDAWPISGSSYIRRYRTLVSATAAARDALYDDDDYKQFVILKPIARVTKPEVSDYITKLPII